MISFLKQAWTARQSLRQVTVPKESMLGSSLSGDAVHSDAFQVEVQMDPALDVAQVQSRYCRAFFTSPLFKLERLILKLTTGSSSSDAEILQSDFAAPGVDSVSMFKLKERDDHLSSHDIAESGCLFSWDEQIGRTFLGVTQVENGKAKLVFGSALKVREDLTSGVKGAAFSATLQLHLLYSKALILSAAAQIQKQSP